MSLDDIPDFEMDTELDGVPVPVSPDDSGAFPALGGDVPCREYCAKIIEVHDPVTGRTVYFADDKAGFHYMVKERFAHACRMRYGVDPHEAGLVVTGGGRVRIKQGRMEITETSGTFERWHPDRLQPVIDHYREAHPGIHTVILSPPESKEGPATDKPQEIYF